jgi:signal transduction histidine kinase
MKRRFRPRMWPVFVVGIGSLLALLFLPGIAALRRTRSVYGEIQQIQESNQRTQKLVAEIQQRIYVISITVREALLDTSSAAQRYKIAFGNHRERIEELLNTIRQSAGKDGAAGLPSLQRELDSYFGALEPVFDWTPEERRLRATYFLREQQRPRRQSILELANVVGRLAETSHAKQIAQVNFSQGEFEREIYHASGVAFLIGLIIAVVTIARMMKLEERDERTETELRNLSARLMQAHEEERKTISRELHDEVGQVLTGLRMGLGALEPLRGDPEGFRERVTEIKSLAEQATKSVREIAIGLRPSVLDLGLVPAVQWQARQLSKYSGVRADVRVEGVVGDIPEAHRTCAYRVIQECLTNVVKHAAAKTIEIEIRGENRMLKVVVRDDGGGFRRTKGGGLHGLGLIGMEERARELGGSLKIEALRPRGTSVSVRLPLPKPAA